MYKFIKTVKHLFVSPPSIIADLTYDAHKERNSFQGDIKNTGSPSPKTTGSQFPKAHWEPIPKDNY